MNRNLWVVLGAVGALVLLVASLLLETRDSGEVQVERPPTATARPTGMDRGLLLVRDQQLLLRDMTSGQEYEIARTPTADSYYSYPVWSPDGRRIAYTISRQFTGVVGQDWGSDVAIRTLASGEEQVVLPRSKPGITIEGVAWTPDGGGLYLGVLDTRIDGGRFLGQTATLERLDLASGDRIKLGEGALYPAVSPRGDRLAFITSGSDLEPGGLWTANLSGQNVQLVARVPSQFLAVNAPSFSPDGARVAFSALAAPRSGEVPPARRTVRRWPWEPKAAEAHGPPMDIWVSPVDGGSPERLTSFMEEDLRMAWSPDGTQIALISARGLSLLPLGGDPQRIGRGALEAQMDWR